MLLELHELCVVVEMGGGGGLYNNINVEITM